MAGLSGSEEDGEEEEEEWMEKKEKDEWKVTEKAVLYHFQRTITITISILIKN